jgi:hypothetical protein
MALDLDKIKTIQSLVTEMNTTATFLSKLRESKEISFTVSGITTKITAKEEETFRLIFDSLYQANDKKLDMLIERINKILYSDKEFATKAEA